ncbi:MAG: helix-turn-helix domain-containing protein [Cellulosilyticum sp.]|nr:helix-turn-helix domain-containing protein [Cellulosilyticum sp.]
MKNLRKLYLHNSIFRFMISYAGVLLIPLLVCLLSYQFTFKIVKEEITQNNLAMLTQNKNLIDEQVKTISSLMMQIADNNKVEKFSNQTLVKKNVFFKDATDVIEELAYIFKYSNTDILSDLCLYIDKSDYIVTRYELYRSQLYHEMVLEEDISYEDWIAQLMNKDNFQEFITTENQIKCIQRLPIGSNKAIEGSVICSIDKEKIKQYFINVDIDGGADLFIQDKEGRVLLQLSDEEMFPEIESKEEIFTQNINGIESTVFKLTSKETGWTYTLILPEHIFMQKLTDLKTIIMGIFLGAVIIGIIISYYMANKSGRPIEEVKKQLLDLNEEVGIQVEEIASTSSLSGTLAQIVSQKKVLSEEIEKQKPYLESVLFQKLIKGEFIGTKELQYICQRTHIELDAESYWVVNCRFFGNNDLFNLDEQTMEDVNLLKILLQEATQKVMNQKMYFYDLDQLTTTIILPKSDMSYESIKESINRINEQMQNEYMVMPSWGISSEARSLLQLWRAFDESKSALKKGIEEGKTKLSEYNELEIDQTTYYYMPSVEKQLLVCTKEGDSENIKKLWEMVYTENFVHRTLSHDTIDKLYVEIKGTILKMAKRVDTKFTMEEMEQFMLSKNQEDIKKCFDKIIEVCFQFCAEYGQEKKFQQSKLIHRITEYINENYANSNLGLGMIASNFNISEGYVSSLFKEQVGINFTEYVETQRIDKACELLRTTDVNINDISEQVGYNSVQSFRRAFKRMHGFSPSELRKNRT